MLQEGDKAPVFKVLTDSGEEFDLAKHQNERIVLYFYPRADTPGCTIESCEFRDAAKKFTKKGVTILGISPDTTKDQLKFKEKFDLNFTLLADADHAVADLYGTWGEKSMYGRTYMGVARSTFIIDADGVVAHVIPKASPKTHDEQVLALLAS